VSGAWNRSPGFFDACSILLKDESLRQLLAKRIKNFDRKGEEQST
jgi:hypothetical protein